MARKGIAEQAPAVISYMFVFVIITGVLLGYNLDANKFLKKETLDLQSERIQNAALGLQSLPEGAVKMSLTGYEFDIESREMILGYGDESVTTDLSILEGYSELKWSYSEPQKLDEGLCIKKTKESGENILRFYKGDCPSV